MSSFGANGLTNKGRNLQAKAQAGAQLKYTKFVMGSGALGNQSIPNLTAVITPRKTVNVTRLFVDPQAQRATVGMYFTNADVTTGFTWREIGLYAIDPDEGEILYWYGNAGDAGDYIPPGNGSEILEQTYDAIVYVGTATNIVATIDTSLVFATIQQLNQTLADSKTYTDQKVATVSIPDASLTQKGKVQLNDSTESVSDTSASTPKAVRTAKQEAINAAKANDEEVILPLANANAQGYANAAVAPIISADNPNMLKNSAANFNLYGWSNTGSVGWSWALLYDRGYKYFSCYSGVAANQFAYLESQPISVTSGTYYNLQALFNTLGVTSSTGVIYVGVLNASNGALIKAVHADFNKSWHRKSESFSVPSGVTTVKIVLTVSAGSSAMSVGNKYVTRIKLSIGAVDVPYTAEADDLALFEYQNKIRSWGAL
ncbi:tail fiber protein [Paenibacillus pabuli]|uniref:tail fiber protein n=1 Tax=Paenibacillus pabuli TaxID=1472 RepID=UPI001FFEEF0B|nr:tail fiber protein [Paenibacillus pabuli]UPK45904.1 tail fiber protein [Paenibacillus pabuli]